MATKERKELKERVVHPTGRQVSHGGLQRAEEKKAGEILIGLI
jgi:hypothetical protein